MVFERLLQLIRAHLLCFEQPRVFDSDYGLVGEALEQVDLAVRERPWLGACHENDADRCAIPQHGNKETASHADRTAEGLIPVLRVDLDIRYVDNRSLEDRRPIPNSRLGRVGNLRCTTSRASGA